MKSERPNLDKELDGKTFRSFYYLKEELTDFCRKNGLPATGGKIELTDRIACFLDTGNILPSSKKTKIRHNVGIINENTKIEPDFVCTQKHRAFFEDNQGKSLEEAIKCWKYKKSLQGHNRYEKSDLIALS